MIAGRLWVHALSVGEVLSAIPLLEALKNKYPSREIVLSVKTDTGLDVARKKLKDTVNYLLPMPLDFWWSARRMIKNINPIIFILVETDIWPGLISLLKKRGVKTILVNGRLSPQTAKSYRRWRFVIKRVLQMVELFLMQTELDKRRIIKGGLCPDKVKVTGNIKFDRSWIPLNNKERDRWLDLLNLKNMLIWVAGSTHHPEEKIIFNVFSQLRKYFPDLSLIIGPREAHRFDEVYNLAKDCGLKVIRKTQLSVDQTATVSPISQARALRGGPPASPEYRRVGRWRAGNQKYNVFILNTLGELGQVYGLADIAFVGGSLVPKGGHNLLEPAFFGIPVLFGPYTYNFTTMSELMIKYKGGKMVADESELLNVMLELLAKKSKRNEIGKRAKEFVEQNQGALDKVMGILEPYIEMS
ncbi:MAG: 3-deoxy-D-manno-octulosonic acid transferase [Deltaproteobacteria bacterium]|nr:3-deoxy-D-manno-octulosonic acid transferase [Deltaproteobacteria bacterium]